MKEPTVLLRYSDLLSRGIVRNRQMLSILIKDHGFPKGFMLTPNCHVYDQADVEAWLQGRRGAAA